MKRNFKWFYEQYGEEARSKFEDVCFDIFDSEYLGNVHRIRIEQGDGGTDLGIDAEDEYIVVQCKFFTSKLEDSQKAQIRESFKKVIEDRNGDLDKWILCMSINLSNKEEKWWKDWKDKKKVEFNQQYGKDIKIKLFDQNKIIKLLNKYDLYDQYFNTIRIDKDFLNTKKEGQIVHDRIYPVISELFSGEYYPKHLIDQIESIKDLRANKYFSSNSIIPNLEEISDLLAVYGDKGFVKDERAQKAILNLCYEIRDEYRQIDWD
ncbi:restriction endonuclease [Bacillus cereus group sp. MYBK30-1]|uniref:restriction endonuclease n=1 Tax=unclassified Bacillus cereus group TaxID=2750818 RepID=UPI003F79096F